MALAGAVLSSLSASGEAMKVASRGDHGEWPEVVNEVFVARTSQPGTLAEVIGDYKNNTDSIVVEGPINAADFKVLWEATFYNVTTVINLEKAVIEEGRIPDSAFYNDEVQTQDVESKNKIYVPQLRHIILGDGIDEIGDRAFYYADNLGRVTYTAPVRRIGKEAFANCRRFGRIYPVVFPEGMEVIDDFSFEDTGHFVSVKLPSTLKYLGINALINKGLTEIEIPESIERMGSLCLAYNPNLKELVLPDKEIEFAGRHHFTNNYGMTRLVLPSRMENIPQGFCEGCAALQELTLPEGIETIGTSAFNCCYGLKSVTVPEGVKIIGPRAFKDCLYLEHITLPSTLETISSLAFDWCDNLKTVLCKGAVPAVCTVYQNATPFGDDNTTLDAVLGVPEGCGAQYRAAGVWKNFSSIRELSPEQFDDFAGVESVSASQSAVTVRGESGAVVIEGGEGESFAVVGADGRTAAQGRLSEGITRVSAAPGVYIVKAGQETRKVAVR